MTKTSRRLLRRRDVRSGRLEGGGGGRISGKPEQHAEPDPDWVESLVRTLDSDDPAERSRARIALVRMGRPVGPWLTHALAHQKGQVRWEAAMALGLIRDPASAAALVQALEDDMLEVRWAAADGLLALERDGLVALLRGLIARSGSIRLRESAHRILSRTAHGEDGPILRPVLEALESTAPMAALPIAAYTALNSLKGQTSGSV